jgi:hypothetical protein
LDNTQVPAIEKMDFDADGRPLPLMRAPDAAPYVRFAVKIATSKEPDAEWEKIAQLPLNKRYVWRVATALQWALGDLSDLSLAVDRATMSFEDLAKLKEQIETLPLQFCLLFKSLCGTARMERIILEALNEAKNTEIARFQEED